MGKDRIGRYYWTPFTFRGHGQVEGVTNASQVIDKCVQMYGVLPDFNWRSDGSDVERGLSGERQRVSSVDREANSAGAKQ